MDNTTITVKRLRSATVFKLLLIGNLVFLLPLSLLAGVLSMFGASTIIWNDQVVTGLPALLVSPLSGALFALVFSVLGWVSVFIGLWIYSAFRPLQLEFIPLVGDRSPARAD
jgi:hypothetical protein